MPRVTSPRTSRSQVTRIFLFTDLREYTRFVEAHGDVAASQLLRDYRTIVRREVTRTHGAEIKTEGDSFYIVFEAAVPALECAIAILDRIDAHNTRSPARRLSVGAGLHAGDAVAYDGQYVGGAVIVASRLCAKAGAGELLLSDTVRGLIRTAQTHALRDRGTVTLKGVSEPVHVWSFAPGGLFPRPVGDVAGTPLPTGELRVPAPTGQLVCPVLVGREPELAAYRDALARSVAGQGAVLFVSGEPGVGKSAFVREVVRVAATLGFRLLPGAAVQWERGLPYAPFLSALRGGFPADALRDIVGRTAPDLGPLLPELGQPGAAVDSPLERHRIGRAFNDLIRGVSRQAPLLVVLEDLHWVDEASIALLQQLAREIQQQPVVLLITYRSDEVHRRHPLTALIGELGRARLALTFRLDALGPGQTDELVGATLGGAALEREVLDAIHARSEGNPFFTEELLKSLVESGAIVRDSGTGWRRGGTAALQLPETLRDLVLARLERLAPSTRETLSVASVIGARFEYDTMRRVREIDDSALTGDLREAVDEQLLVERREVVQGPASFAFRHALGREVIYDDLLLPERQRIHLLVGEALSSAGTAPPALVAHHWSAGGDRRRAAAAYEEAGNAALSVNAAAEAVAHFEAAISASDQATVSQYLGLARAYQAIDHSKSRAAAERGMQLLGPADALATRIDLMRIAGRARWLMGDAAGNFALARAAVGIVEGTEDSRAKADTFDWYANAHTTREDLVAAREWAERALSVAKATGARATAASALLTLARCESVGSPAAALDLVDEAAAIARGATAAEVLARAHAGGIAYAFQVGPARPRLVRIERALEFSRRYGHGASWFAAYRALHRFASGDWPALGGFGTSGDVEGDTHVAWVTLLDALVSCAREGPGPDALSRIGALACRAVARDEPQWGIPWLSYASLAQAWAGRADAARDSIALMLEVAAKTEHPARSLTRLSRGVTVPSIVLLLARERDQLERMAAALVDVDGHAGERLLLASFVAWLDGAAVDVPLRAASNALAERGLQLSTALSVCALAAVRPGAALPDDVRTAAITTLQQAEATWLLSALPKGD